MTPRKMKHAETPPNEPRDVRPEYLRRKEAASFLGLAPGTLANWASSGRGPSPYRVGSRVLYDTTELRRFIEAGRVEMVTAR